MIIGIINGISQDTFSIVAMDPITGEVGSAGASCVDLDANNLPTDDFFRRIISWSWGYKFTSILYTCKSSKRKGENERRIYAK